MRETLMEYQTLLMRHKDCPQYRAMGGYCGHQILASIERFKGSVFGKFALLCSAWRTDDGWTWKKACSIMSTKMRIFVR